MNSKNAMNVFTGIKAIIFDCDGVIADTERAHYAAFAKALASEGIKLNWEEYCAKYLAMDDEGCIKQALRRNGTEDRSPKSEDRRPKTEVRRPKTEDRSPTTSFFGPRSSVNRSSVVWDRNDDRIVKKIKAAKAKLYWKALANGHLKIYPGVKNFVKRLAVKRYLLAIASGSSRREVKFILKSNNLQPYFKVIIAAEDVRNGKPHPEAYRRALTELNRRKGKSTPSECLVIEDSIHGVQSAKKAGMKCLAVANTYPANKLKAAGADLVVSSLQGVARSKDACKTGLPINHKYEKRHN